MLVDSECCIEDSFITKNALFAVECVNGGELAVLQHCDLRSRGGKKLFSVVDFTAEDGGDAVECGKNIYTSLCTTDAGSEGELRLFPWYVTSPRRNIATTAAVAATKIPNRNSFDDTHPLDLECFDDYILPQEAAAVSSKKRVRIN